MPESDMTPEEWDVAMESCADSLVQELGGFDRDASSAGDVARVLTAKLLGPRPAEPTPLQLAYEEIGNVSASVLADAPLDKQSGYDKGFLNGLQFVRDNILPIIGPEEK